MLCSLALAMALHLRARNVAGRPACTPRPQMVLTNDGKLRTSRFGTDEPWAYW